MAPTDIQTEWYRIVSQIGIEAPTDIQKTLKALADHARAVIENLQKDRERLEWMAENAGVIEKHPDIKEWCVVADGVDCPTDWCVSWREAIDEAMTQRGEG